MEKQTFPDWTTYDAWLIDNYNNYSMCNVNEINGKIEAEYCLKSEFESFNAEYKESHKNQ